MGTPWRNAVNGTDAEVTHAAAQGMCGLRGHDLQRSPVTGSQGNQAAPGSRAGEPPGITTAFRQVGSDASAPSASP